MSISVGSISFPSTGSITTSDIASAFTPLSLFSAGANGFWLDLDPDTWFEDTSFTTPSTFGNPIGAWADKSGNALHALQSVAASRPTYGRMPYGGVRNQLTYTEDVSNAAWTKNNVTAGSATSVIESATVSTHSIVELVPITSGVTYTMSVTVGKGVLATAPDFVQLLFGSTGFGVAQFAIINVLTGDVVSTAGGATCTSSADPDIAGAWRFVYTATATATTTAAGVGGIVFCNNNSASSRAPSYLGVITSDVSVYKQQFEIGSVATSYQKVVQGYDVTEPGVVSVPCPWFDAVDDHFDQAASAASLTQNIGRFTVFGGVNFTSSLAANRAIFHASTGTLATSSRAILRGEATNTLAAKGRRLDADSLDGPTFAQSQFANTVGTGVFDYTNSNAYLRKNGALVATDTTFQTDGDTSNTASLAVYIGRVDTAYISGFIAGVVAVAADALSDSQLLQTETYIGRQIGGTGL